MATLHGLSCSPWTWRARWALDHHRIDYDYREHTPMLGERRLRRLAEKRQRLKPATRRIWTNEPLAAEFADLVQWRDELLARHR